MIEQGGATMPAGQDDWARYLSTLWPRERLPELQREAPVQDLFASYRDESAVLARLIAYQGSYLAAAPASTQAPVVTARENATALSVVRRRVATAGYRIADMLASALADARARRHFCPTAS